MKMNEFKLERYFAKYEFSAKYLLCSSDPEPLKLHEVLELDSETALDELKNLSLGYTDTKGSPELRIEVSKLYKSISNENVLITSSAEEAIFLFMNSILNSNDHVIVHFPNYQSLEESARYKCCEITRWEVKEENDWDLNIDFLKSSIKENTKAIILNIPHNPTGYILSRQKLEQIVDIAREKNIILFCDEVYRFLEYDTKSRLPAMCDLYENGVSIGAMAKAFSLPGLRIGWAATNNKKIIEAMAMFKDYTTICNSAPSEFLSTIALRNKDKIIRRNLELINGNLNILNAFFEKHKNIFDWKQPKAGTIGFPSLKIDINADEFCERLIEKSSVMLLPSTKYNYGNKNIRFGFGRKNMTLALNELEKFLSESFNLASKT